ncbi:hypothetical protein EC968_003363 [Mortierella alpina]|nr:hypothetical protein EC968_003363 [Mortierella alpina]
MEFPGQGRGRRQGLWTTLLLLFLGIVLLPSATTAWPYVDCSGPGSILELGAVTAHFDPSNKVVVLDLQGSFTGQNPQTYTALSTSQWRVSIVTTIVGSQLHRSEGPACSMIAGGCPTAPGPASISTNFTITQTAPFAELMASVQIMGGNNQTIACVAILLEQKMETVNTAVGYLPLALAVYSGAISLTSILLRATVGNGFLGALATYGLASTSDVISVHTPGLFDIIFYTQFMVMTGQLSVNYPSFYSTFTSLFHWSFLEFRNSFAGNGPDNSSYVLAYGGAGSVNQIKEAPSEWNGKNLSKRLLAVDWPLDDLDASWPTIRALPVASTTRPENPVATMKRKRQLELTTNAVSPTQPPETTTTSVETTSSSTTEEPSPTTTSSSSSKSKSRSAAATSQPSLPTATATASPTASPSAVYVVPVIKDPFRQSRQYNVSRFGMEAYAAAIGAYPSKLFLCTFINTVMVGGASLFVSGFLLVIAWFLAKESHLRGKTLQHAFNFVAGNLLRVWALLYTPLALSAMYQLTIAGGSAMMAIASASLLMLSVGATVFLTWRILRASSELQLFEDLGTLLKYGTLYNTLTEEGTLFFLVTLLVRFLWGLSVAMLSSYGIAQVAVLMVVELGYMLVIGLKWPFSESGDNKVHLFLGFVRIVVTGCSIAYVHDLDTSPEVRQLFGYIQMAFHLAVFIVMFALVLWNTIQVVLFWQTRHSSAWRGPTKSYTFEGPPQTEHDWDLTSRPLSHQPDPRMSHAAKTRRYTVQPYTSVGDLLSVPDSEGYQHRSLYRHSHQPPDRRRSRFPSDDDPGLTLDLRPEAIIPLSSSAGPISARSTSPHPHSPGASIESVDGPSIALQPTQLSSSARFQPQRESYARIQRMSHQQGTPDLRSRRMSEIFRDGRYVYVPDNAPSSPTSAGVQEEKQSAWASMKDSLSGLFGKIGSKSVRRSIGDGSKPKAFEVMRPPRPPPITLDSSRDGRLSRDGGDELRELNSIGISRFFQESGLNNERNRSLFVANPEAMASQAGSLRSSISGMPPAPARLNRTASEATSVYTLSHKHKAGQSFVNGVESLAEQETPESRRVSVLSGPQYPRNSVESSIAEALMTDSPLILQGGGILKVSKGPEKAVQYWRKESGQYVESPGESDKKPHPVSIATPPPLLLLPTTRGPLFEASKVDVTTNGSRRTPSIRSRDGSRPESPTESLHSSNVAASAGRMHEILDRMFSDHDDDDDSDMISDGESCSTFSGRVSATILALHQKREYEESLVDSQSLYRSDALEPVPEQQDAEQVEQHSLNLNSPRIAKRTASTSGRSPLQPRPNTLTRTFSGPARSSPGSSSALLLRPSKSGSLGRPLAQTPLHSPSVLPFSESTTSLHQMGTLSRQSSKASLQSKSYTPTIQEHEQDPLEALACNEGGPLETSAIGTIHNKASPHPLQPSSTEPGPTSPEKPETTPS